MKNQKGITLISLVTTIVLIAILASVSTYTGIEAYNNMRVQAFLAKMITIQEKVDIFCDKYSVKEINNMGVKYSEAGSEEKAVLNEVIANSSNLKCWYEVDNSTANYRYFSILDIERKIGLEGFDVGIWLNPLTRNVIAVKGVKEDGIKYYRQYDLAGGQTLSAPVINRVTTLNVSVKTYDNKASVILDKKYAKVTCNLKNSSGAVVSTKVFTNTDEVIVTESGKYQLIATDYDRNVSDYSDYDSETQNNYAGLEKTSSDFVVTIVNKPMLYTSMTPIDDKGNILDTEEKLKDWYNYDPSVKKWANVRLRDGSRYVWIPRYAYSINSTDKTIDIKFLKDFSNVTTEGKILDSGYKVAPAFQNGSQNGFINGEWDNEISGFWVAKYEVTTDDRATWFDCPRSQATTSAFYTYKIAPKDAFAFCRKMESSSGNTFFEFNGRKVVNLNADTGFFETDTNNIDTHLMKNSEFGAVIYLTYSIYGNTGITAHNSIYPGYISGTTLAPNSSTTTNNTYGIYGISGGLPEITAAGYTIEGIFNTENVSTRYATRYYDLSKEPHERISIYGDGISDVTAWTANRVEPTESAPLFLRGGTTSSGNMFSYENSLISTIQSCRPVIIVEY